jgi:hypothetical protein
MADTKFQRPAFDASFGAGEATYDMAPVPQDSYGK